MDEDGCSVMIILFVLACCGTIAGYKMGCDTEFFTKEEQTIEAYGSYYKVIPISKQEYYLIVNIIQGGYFMKKSFLKKIVTTSIAAVMCLSIITPFFNSTSAAAQTKAKAPIPGKVLVGYWHNFNNGTGTIKLRDVSPDWDVINLSFGEGTSVTSGDIVFVEGFPPES